MCVVESCGLCVECVAIGVGITPAIGTCAPIDTPQDNLNIKSRNKLEYFFD